MELKDTNKNADYPSHSAARMYANFNTLSKAITTTRNDALLHPHHPNLFIAGLSAFMLGSHSKETAPMRLQYCQVKVGLEVLVLFLSGLDVAPWGLKSA